MKRLIIAFVSLVFSAGSFATDLTCSNDKIYTIDLDNKYLIFSWSRNKDKIPLIEVQENTYIFKGPFFGGPEEVTYYIDRTTLRMNERIRSMDGLSKGMEISNKTTSCQIVEAKI